ncbi:ABC transporter permease [Lacisediminimonas sp.]|uniref:ABC transporter permease n=1 Tax=Lacisediminimonas sp. TaxID=3060582 RepID=UPI002720E117|nr:ABC transporter permease [Lacisediminimonas sp.]MDO8299560.1 ABC transporter permease [Lacisediminimonas sp.]MDO9217691.1 ABC transporter permease [Lacisediminimonas sp.]
MRSRAEPVVITLAALALALALFALFLMANRLDPWAVYSVLWLGGFGTSFSLQATLTQAAPLMLTALCVAIPARAGLLIIGGEGALAVGGIFAVLAGVGMPNLAPVAGTIVVCIVGALGGAAWIVMAGALKHLRGVNETISTLLLNYIALALLNHLVSGPMRDPAVSLKPTSWSIPTPYMMGNVPEIGVHGGLLIGAVVCLLSFALLKYTVFGFATGVVGGNVRAAQLVGLPIGRLTLLVCALGGAAAGLAGAIEIVAVHGAASSSLAVGFGYGGILVAFLARQNPMAIIFFAFVVGGISASGGLMQRRFDMPDAATQVLQGLIFLCVLASNTLYGRFPLFRSARAAA